MWYRSETGTKRSRARSRRYTVIRRAFGRARPADPAFEHECTQILNTCPVVLVVALSRSTEMQPRCNVRPVPAAPVTPTPASDTARAQLRHRTRARSIFSVIQTSLLRITLREIYVFGKYGLLPENLYIYIYSHYSNLEHKADKASINYHNRTVFCKEVFNYLQNCGCGFKTVLNILFCLNVLSIPTRHVTFGIL